ncbi:MAG TPA: hypothetical protein PLJ62_14380 [Thermoflexales bacterium]|nr:hypothetical protein [Thermoflexales bacterium]HQW35214.1 hypothetical protein [Thermoflexales bacterium]HQZ21895.1 hypothetical protein [Thermoflexales bacterium]HRA01389.1 hypothetical protein [Thermoflexales bacterium]
MTPKLAFRFIFAALAFGLLIVTAGLGISRLQQQTAAAPVDITQMTEAQLAAGRIRLDADGNGAQVFDGTSVNVRAQPWPPVAGQAEEVRVVVISADHRVLRGLRPTLFLARDGQTETPTQPLAENADGSYSIRTSLLQPGVYRGQISIPAQNDVLVILLELNAK